MPIFHIFLRAPCALLRDEVRGAVWHPVGTICGFYLIGPARPPAEKIDFSRILFGRPPVPPMGTGPPKLVLARQLSGGKVPAKRQARGSPGSALKTSYENPAPEKDIRVSFIAY